MLVSLGADIDESYGKIPSPLQVAHNTTDINMFKSFIDGGTDIEKLHINDRNLNMNSQQEIIEYSNQQKSQKEVATTKEESVKEEVSTKDISGPTFEFGE